MPGDMSARATTFSTVVRDGPWMCSAEMQASISRCRCRAREARSGAGLAPLLVSLAVALPAAFAGAPGAPPRAAALAESPPPFPLATLLGFFLFTAPSLSRKIPHRHLSGGNHEIAGAAGPLAHHPPATAVPHGLLPDSVRVRLQDQPGRDGTPGTALYRHLHAYRGRSSAGVRELGELQVSAH